MARRPRRFQRNFGATPRPILLVTSVARLRLVSSSASGASADIVVMGRTAADAFESNANVLSAYDKLRISPGTTGSRERWMGNSEPWEPIRGIPLYVYEAEYKDSAGAMQPFVPPDNVLIAASSLGGTMAYAGVGASGRCRERPQGVRGTASARRGLRGAWKTIRKFRLSSRPVPVPQNLAAWSLLDVL